jgi:hypothetical protein
VRRIVGDPLRVEGWLQSAPAAQMCVPFAGEQTLAEQKSRTYEPPAFTRTSGVRGQQLPDLGGIVNQQNSLRSHPKRGRTGAAGHEQVQELDRRATERTHQCHVDLQRSRRSAEQVRTHTAPFVEIDSIVLTNCAAMASHSWPCRKTLDASRIR